MAENKKKIDLKKFFLNIILPTLLSILLFIVLIFWYIIPYFESNLLLSKKEMIRELVNSTISVANKNYNDFKSGKISEEQAKNDAIEKIRSMRYGIEDKDYFFITDMKPNMIMHPYRIDLDGKDLSDFKDPNGKTLFIEMVYKVKVSGEGFVDYKWQWMDDSNRIVQKISYVCEFKPWGWVIGTGIYIEDIKIKIADIERELILVSIAISFLIAILLTMIVFQNLKTEIKRSKAESELLVSKEKYQTLVEASTEGTAMVLEGEMIYSNRIFDEMLHTLDNKHFGKELEELINPKYRDDISRISEFMRGDSTYFQLETNLRISNENNIDVLLSLSKISLSNKNGLILIVKELQNDNMFGAEKSEWTKKVLNLYSNINFGLLRIDIKDNYKFIEFDEQLLSIFSYPSKNDLQKMGLIDIAEDSQDCLKFINIVKRNGFAKDFKLSIRNHKKELLTVLINANLDLDSSNSQESIFCVVSDISKQLKNQELIESEYNEIQSSMLHLSLSLRHYTRETVSCNMNLSAQKAALLMKTYNTDVLLIKSADGNPIGIVTDADLRSRLIDSNLNTEQPVFEIMTSPIQYLDENAMLSEAILKMQDKGIHHIIVKNSHNEVSGIVGIDQILKNQFNSIQMLLMSIKNANSLVELSNIYKRLQIFVASALDSGGKSDFIIRTISNIAHTITNRINDLIIMEIGEAPVPFAFITLGSEGRNEQTLITDQDNAIIYEDVSDDKSQEVENYFARYAERMNYMLDYVGYAYCKGDIMAKNPKWNKPISTWKRYFKEWISNPEPQNLLEIAVFFDMKLTCGEYDMLQDLLQYVNLILKENIAFFGFMARIGISYKNQLNIFGKIQTESNDEHSKSVNVKNAIRVIVHLVRLYSMKNNLTETNTLKRLKLLYEKGVFSQELYRDIVFSYEFLTIMQLKTQVISLKNDIKPDNYVDLNHISSIEVSALKSIFSQISVFQSKLKYDFGINE